ncbi:type II toxin-antitoxin system toxin DNA ADP-ribosyl transferase DarT [Vibrio chemaguriensis]|nr:DUF4433 domain-containing protein [Vibrio parahaemolyticus]
MTAYPNPTPIYHFTHIDNLQSLVSSGGLISKNAVDAQSIQYKNSAYASVQGHREQFPVPVAPYGVIHDYVPFYFNSRSPMLYTVKMGNIPGVDMRDVIFFQSTAQTIESAGKAFVFTDGHGIMSLTDYYNKLSDMHNVPWQVVQAQFWGSYPDGKRERQAEFLVQNYVEWALIDTIGVYNQAMKLRVENIIQNLAYRPKVEIKLGWYF